MSKVSDERQVFLCRASGEGTHNFRIVRDEDGVIEFYDEMFGKDMDGSLDGAIEHFRDDDNWSNSGTEYSCALYCATLEVWKVDQRDLALPSQTRPDPGFPKTGIEPPGCPTPGACSCPEYPSAPQVVERRKAPQAAWVVREGMEMGYTSNNDRRKPADRKAGKDQPRGAQQTAPSPDAAGASPDAPHHQRSAAGNGGEEVASSASQPAFEYLNPPFSGCKFQHCDLPGQCLNEGRCHHPQHAPKSFTEFSLPAQPAASAAMPRTDETRDLMKHYVEALERNLAESRATADRALAELHLMKTCGIIEIMVRNPSVDSWAKHWEGRAIKAEAELAALSAELARAREGQ